MIPEGGIETHIARMPVSDGVQFVMDQLRRNGAASYVVGGAIRDWVWNPDAFDPDQVDWDLTTDADPGLLARLAIGDHPGERFGTYQLADRVEVTRMREEDLYGDGRHPDHVRWTSDIVRDLKRRDFTVNAVGFDRYTVFTVDHAGDDLSARRLRAVGSPVERFSEDPLRMVRLVRLMGCHGTVVDTETWKALHLLAPQTTRVSRERRLAEFVKFLNAPSGQWHLWNSGSLGEALEWQAGWNAVHAKAMVRVPTSGASRIAAFAVISHGTLAAIHDWIRTWPLPREWRQALLAVEGESPELDPDRWARLARNPRQRHADVFRELAEAFGVPKPRLAPLVLALSAADLKRGWPLHGAAVGEVMQRLRDAVEGNPDLNQEKYLARLVDAFLQ